MITNAVLNALEVKCLYYFFSLTFPHSIEGIFKKSNCVQEIRKNVKFRWFQIKENNLQIEKQTFEAKRF